MLFRSTAPAVEEANTRRYDGLRIGYPKDKAFGFYYPDDLDRMRELGAELLCFNALETPRLPVIDGLFIGGGFPETAMHELERNRSLMRDIVAFIEAKGERVEPDAYEGELPDLKDLPFVEVALSGEADAIVTGNRRHFPDSLGIAILSPGEFLERLDVAGKS